jgi:hypothetical protein
MDQYGEVRVRVRESEPHTAKVDPRRLFDAKFGDCLAHAEVPREKHVYAAPPPLTQATVRQ